MTSIGELAELRQQVQSLMDANSELHGDLLVAEQERDKLRALVAAIIHYPDHWGTVAYPALQDALDNIDASYQGCTECADKALAKIKAEAVREACTEIESVFRHRTPHTRFTDGALHALQQVRFYANQIEGGENG